MTMIALASMAALLTAAASGPQLSKSDFQELIKAVVLDTSSAARINHADLVCVQQQFAPPLEFAELAPSTAWSSSTSSDAAVKEAITAALASGHVTAQIKLASVPDVSVALPAQVTGPGHLLHFVLLSSRSPRRSDCTFQRGIFTPRAANRPLPYVLTLTRPVVVNGFVFIKHAFDCPGMCGSGQISVFKKSDGKWTHVATRDSWVS
jgi:hypothetical protein